MTRLLRILVVLVLAAPAGLAAQGVLAGRIREDSTGRPLAGVEVLVQGTSLRTTTDGEGRYLIGAVPAGRRTALFRKIGFLPVRTELLVVTGDTVRANAAMAQGEIRLAPIEVTGKAEAPRGIGLEAFEERRERGLGVFFDSTEIRRNEHYRVRDFLFRVPGMARRAAPDGSPCLMAIYIDGIYQGGGGAPTGDNAKPPPDLNREIMMDQLAAIEVYRGAAEAPVEYGGTTGACGVVLLWTRRR